MNKINTLYNQIKKVALLAVFLSTAVMFCDESSSDSKDGYQVTMKKESEQRVGKSELSFTVTKDDEPVTGLALEVEAEMQMHSGGSGMALSHSTFLSEVSERGAGIYDVTARYLMPSMNDTTHLGDWSIHVSAAEFSEEFEVMVMGSMMDRFTLSGAEDDTFNSEGTESKRPYVAFLEEAGDIVQLFIGYRNMMMDHQPLDLGNTLKFFDGSTEQVSAIIARVSTDAATWINITNDGDGLFSTDELDISGADKIYLSLTVNGRETTNGENSYVAITLP